MKLIDMILNPKYADKKDEIIVNCCPSGFGLKDDCIDGSTGMCKECWNKESEVESNE